MTDKYVLALAIVSAAGIVAEFGMLLWIRRLLKRLARS